MFLPLHLLKLLIIVLHVDWLNGLSCVSILLVYQLPKSKDCVLFTSEFSASNDDDDKHNKGSYLYSSYHVLDRVAVVYIC